jgi:hypothetical protein
MRDLRISQRVSAWDVLPALRTLLLVVGVSLYLVSTSGVWGARAPDVRPSSGAQGKALEVTSKSGEFGRFFLWTKN